MVKSMRQSFIDIIRNTTAHPELLVMQYQKDYPGIAEQEAAQLAELFINALKADSTSSKAKMKEYVKKLEPIKKKYPPRRAATQFKFDD